jgi:predicted heme/steroid binding protein
MSFNNDLLEKLMDFNEKNSPKFALYVNDEIYDISHASITNSPIPVNEPTTRGGVYFSDKFAYKMKWVVNDLSVVPLLTKKMLGPNTEFGELKITTDIEIDGKLTPIEISANLTNSVQTPNSIELSLIIVKLESL